MIEMTALILFLVVILAMMVGPENRTRAVRTETVKATQSKPSVAQTA